MLAKKYLYRCYTVHVQCRLYGLCLHVSEIPTQCESDYRQIEQTKSHFSVLSSARMTCSDTGGMQVSKKQERRLKKKNMNERRKKGGKSVEGPRRDTKDSLLRTTDVSWRHSHHALSPHYDNAINPVEREVTIVVISPLFCSAFM